MSVYVNNIVIDAGEDFTQDLTLTDSLGAVVNLTGYAASSYIRKHPESSTIVAGFGISFVSPTTGLMRISLGSTITQNITEGRYVYDVMATTSAGLKNIILEGNVLVRAGITTT